MKANGILLRACLFVVAFALCAASADAQHARRQQQETDAEFGPVVRAYLGYLRGEQEVVDDRASRREISRAYYRRNSNRIRALRQMAIQIARESSNDYLPEMEAVTRDEFKTIFENPPTPGDFQINEVLLNTFRFLGTIRAVETFYIFARLDPYEQADLIRKEESQRVHNPSAPPIPPAKTTTVPAVSDDTSTRQRRVTTP